MRTECPHLYHRLALDSSIIKALLNRLDLAILLDDERRSRSGFILEFSDLFLQIHQGSFVTRCFASGFIRRLLQFGS